MVVQRHQDLGGIPGPMQCEAGSKLGELVIPRHCRCCRQSWVRNRLKHILSILNTLLYFLQLVFIFSVSIVFFTVITVTGILGVNCRHRCRCRHHRLHRLHHRLHYRLHHRLHHCLHHRLHHLHRLHWHRHGGRTEH
jgi:hypothetical protein